MKEKNIALKKQFLSIWNINTLAPEKHHITLPPLLPSFQHDTSTFQKQFQKKKNNKNKRKHDTRCMCR